ncbi:MAG TPA: ABC transporter permease [Spirochaetia bacterium]|nr:ABC transporter permease [Spirochaetia bacterium]
MSGQAAAGRRAGFSIRRAGQKALDVISRGVVGQVAALAIVLVIFAAGTEGTYLSLKNILTILSLAGIPMIICLAIHQVVVIGGMDLSTEGVISLCAVISGFLIKNNFTGYNIGFWAVPISMTLGGLTGLVSGLLNTRVKMPSFIATLGMWWAAQGLSVIIGRGNAVKMLDQRFQNITNGDILGIPNLILMAVAIFAILLVIQRMTKLGKYIYAIGGDEQLARQAGIKVDRIKVIVFVITGVIYGLAAILLLSRVASSNPRTGNGQLFPAMTAVAVGGVSLSGGIGGALNALFGALIVTALNNGMVLMKISPYIQSAVNGVVLILAVAVTIDRRKIGIIK